MPHPLLKLSHKRPQEHYIPKLDLWVTLKEINNPGSAWLLPTESSSLLLDCPLAEGVASVQQESNPINKHCLCFRGEKLLADMSLLRREMFSLKTQRTVW
jgi:hypothetical protein